MDDPCPYCNGRYSHPFECRGKTAEKRLAALEARVREVEGERDKSVKSLTQYGYTDCGGELWKPPLGKRPDFDRIDRLESDLAAARVTIGELVGGLKPFAKDANWHCTVGDDEAFSMNLDGNCSFVPNFVVGDFRRAAALVARHQAQQ